MSVKCLAFSACTAAAIFSSAATAATVTETYDFIGMGDGVFTSVDMMGDQGNTVRVTAGTYPTFSFSATTDADDRVARGNSWGLGAYSEAPYVTSNNHRVDGLGENEILLFEFLDYSATITSITFGSTHGTAFDLFGSDTPNVESAFLPLANGAVDVSAENRSGTTIGIGAFNDDAGFKVRSITVEYDDTPAVPLPAAGWMLLAGLGGLAAAKRRSAKTD